MDRIRGILTGRAGAQHTHTAGQDEYEPLRTSGDDAVEAGDTPAGAGDGECDGDGETYKAAELPFSWFEYTIFALVGVAMLWAW